MYVGMYVASYLPRLMAIMDDAHLLSTYLPTYLPMYTYIPTYHPCIHTEEIVRATQVEFMKRITLDMPQTPFVYAIGNNDLWPNNKNSQENFQVGR